MNVGPSPQLIAALAALKKGKVAAPAAPARPAAPAAAAPPPRAEAQATGASPGASQRPVRPGRILDIRV
jgi:hypothetical protein